METKPAEPTVTEPDVVQQPTHPESAPTDSEPRNFLATFLFTLVGGYVGLRHFYIGNSKIGWLRAGLFIGGYLWLLLMGAAGQATLALLGSLAVIAAGLWAIVDFFYVYFSVRSDADGQPLVSTARDMKWAKVIFWVTTALVVLSLVFGVLVASYAENQLRNGMFQNDASDSPFNSSSPRFENDYRFDSSDL